MDKAVCYQVTCEDGHVGYFPSVYTTLCDFASGHDPMLDDGDEIEDRCLKERTAIPLRIFTPSEHKLREALEEISMLHDNHIAYLNACSMANDMGYIAKKVLNIKGEKIYDPS